MKKQQYFNNLVGPILLVVVLVGIFIFASKPKPKEIVAPLQPEVAQAPVVPALVLPKPVVVKEEPKSVPVVVKPQPTPVPPKPVPEIIKPKPPAEVVKPKPPAPLPKPKPVVEAPKPKVIPEISKPKVVEKAKEPEKPKIAEKPKKRVSLFNIFKPKPKPVAPAPVPQVPLVVTPPPPKLKIVTPVAIKGKIAIVIDDWGYNKNNFAVLDKIHYPFTAAVLPNLSYSRQAAVELHRRGLEIILHLPMEPQGDEAQEKNTVLTSFSENEIKKIMDRDLDMLIYAKGANNHMGSKATEDPKTMEMVVAELKKRDLYFLDSCVTAKTVCPIAAAKFDIPFAKRDVFLDNEDDPEYIRQQLNKLKEIAEKKGYAVGIGHDRKNTMEVLSEAMPEIADEGYKFVFLSELVRK